MRKTLLAVVMVGYGMGMLFLFGAVVLLQLMPSEPRPVMGEGGLYPLAVPDTELWVLQLTEYAGPFLEDPDSGKTVRTAAVLVENRGGLFVSAGAVVLQRQQEQLVFELRDLPPGEKVLVLEKDAQAFAGALGWECCGWMREEYPEQWGWVSLAQLPGGLSVTNVSDQTLPCVLLTYKRRSADGDAFVGGISFSSTLGALSPGETRILSLPHYGQDRIQVVKTVVYWED